MFIANVNHLIVTLKDIELSCAGVDNYGRSYLWQTKYYFIVFTCKLTFKCLNYFYCNYVHGSIYVMVF